ncbi:uncharacterized protein A1O5_05606 [Cladophialophora psammophila CBS 110553]|uniref:Uncharacterized protein n=1 Tax=Cladophialophora psammophila CBS 110553 TaxID=1182543 RepID=W9X4D4_9EURO|nr:uncharacterized protein A1O5_05606 [Cladophialophora psammophila CBS 110553]EXJ71796.1 hypothetical protein A1O5_05606 [Cladophialophora psammophila CBS 110553]
MGFFNNDDGDSDPVCGMPNPLAADAPEPFIGSLSFRQFNLCLSGGCTAFVCLSIFILMARHATHFSKPNEQSKILKICFLLPFYSLLSLLGIAYPNAYLYLDPWRDFWEAIALGSFFLLLCEFVSPSSDFRDVFFAALEVPQSRRAKEKGRPAEGNGLEWYRRRWVFVFQYVVVSLGIAVATNITQAINKYCLESSNIHFSHLWLTIIHNISITVAVTSCIRFYNALKKDLKHHKPLAKFLSFKLIIGLSFIQDIVFTILRSTSTLKPSSTMTYADVNFGIDTMTTCILMVPFAVFFHVSYDVAPYDITKPRLLPLSEIPPQYIGDPRSSQEALTGQNGSQEPFNLHRHIANETGGQYYGGALGIKAWATVPDPREILRAIHFAFTMRTTARRMNREVVGVNPPPYLRY